VPIPHGVRLVALQAVIAIDDRASGNGLGASDQGIGSSMILGGMGPVDALHTTGGKLFAGCYALYCGLVVIVAAGLLLAFAALRLPRTARLALSAALLMAATVLVNLSPPNPYFAATLKVWEQGHFLNFNGLTRLVSSAWPFAALVYLVYLAAGRLREPVR